MLNKLLEYQKVDSKLVKIEKDLENSASKGTVNNMVRLVREAQNHLIQIERSAGDLIAEYKRLVDVYEKEKKCVAELKDKEIKEMNAFELREENNFVTKQIGDVVGLKKSITALSKKIIQKLNEFEKTRQQGVESKKKYDDSIAKYNEFASKQNDNIRKVKQELFELEKDIDPVYIEKYKKMRDEHKYPILVPLLNNSCGICAVQVPNARLDILKKQHMIECENCHRIIYLPE
jgi:predicted  nucleic acid-binding Zn-ribbon protein